jgi:tyrosyl-tRNA synthetase
MINQGAVKIDGEKVSDPKLGILPGTNHIYQIGKRKFARIILILKPD